MLAIRDMSLKGQAIEFPAGDTVQVVRADLEDCKVIGRTTASGLTIIDSSFNRCSIQWKVPLKNASWLSVRFSSCSFEGKYLGNRFGCETHPLRKGSLAGRVESCDFTRSFLDGTSFLNCDMKSIELPGWPFFTILSPSENSNQLLKAVKAMPAPLRTTIEVSATAHPETSAITWSASEILKRGEITEQEIRDALASLPGVNL
jgi:hypothetical protein